jgi:uncharacterized protein
VTEAEYSGAGARTVRLSGTGKQIGGEDYLLQVIVPNVYFHLSMAYAIVRHNGIELGKMDFLGPMNYVDA